MLISSKLENHLQDFFKFLSIPSISGQSEHQKDIRNAATWLQKKFTSLDFHSDILKTKGHPVVYAEFIPPHTNHHTLPTILIYGHYDVQAPEPLNEWSSEPFRPEIRSGNIYGRGVADDKGQLYTWIAAISELKANNKLPQANIKFLIEGEEEVGSRNLTDFIEDNKPLLSADICVVSDSNCLSETQPMIEYGLRGLVYTEITVKTLPKDVHSGIYGGNVLNPIQVLGNIISKLKNKDHEVTIPGFYDNVRKLDRSERKTLSKFPFFDKQVLEETGATMVTGERGFTVHERAGARPTLDINGVWGGYFGEGPKTIIPGEVHAKISMRTVPFQTCEEIFNKFKNYINKITPEGAEINISALSSSESLIIDTKSIFFRKAEKAYQKVFGNKPLYGLSGGTIGVVADLKNILGIDSILMGYGLPDDGLHSPNEKFSVSMFEKGIKTSIEFLKSI